MAPHKESHDVRSIRQCIKKAKNFEIRKLSRKLKKAQEEEALPDLDKKAKIVFNTAKLSEQVDAMKKLKLDPVIQLACSRLGIDDSHLGAFVASNELSAKLFEWAQHRLLTAKCVREVINRIRDRKLTETEAEKHADIEPGGNFADVSDSFTESSGDDDGSQALKSQILKKLLLNGDVSGTMEENEGGDSPPTLNVNDEDADSFFDDDEDLPVDFGSGSSDDDSGEEDARPPMKYTEITGKGHGREEFVRESSAKKKKKQKEKPRNRLGQRERKRLAERSGRITKPTRGGLTAGISKINILPGSKVSKGINSQKGGSQRPVSAPVKAHLNKPLAAKEDPNNHPSWAAKAAQAKKLAMPGSGKKIRFDDDD